MKHLLILSLALLTCCIPTSLPTTVPVPPNLPVGSVLLLTDMEGSCSAVAITPSLALTAGHCVGQGLGYLTAPSGVTYPVETVQLSPDADIALLSVVGDMTVLSPVAPEIPGVGEPVWMAG